jgi:hypothetical protein
MCCLNGIRCAIVGYGPSFPRNPREPWQLYCLTKEEKKKMIGGGRVAVEGKAVGGEPDFLQGAGELLPFMAGRV